MPGVAGAVVRPPHTAHVVPVERRARDQLFVGGPRMREVQELVALAAGCDLPVLIEGETGTGKELVAETLHEISERSTAPLVKVRCTALHDDLAEIELFGHESRGWNDGARGSPGRLELAGEGTILLDELSELPLGFQSKLLRVLDDRQFVKPGGTRLIRTAARVIAATKMDLSRLVADGRFSGELYERLRGLRIVLPPLRDRKEEIGSLADLLREDLCRRFGVARAPLRPDTLDVMLRYRWPGNVRELENFMKRYVVLGDEAALREELSRRLVIEQHLPRGAARS